MPHTSLITKEADGLFYATHAPLTKQEAAPHIAKEKKLDLISLENFTLQPGKNLLDRLTTLDGLSADFLYNSHTRNELKKLKFLFAQVIETAQKLPKETELPRNIIQRAGEFIQTIHARIVELNPKKQATPKEFSGDLVKVKEDLTATFGRRTFNIHQTCFEIGNSCLKALDTQDKRFYYILDGKLHFNRSVRKDEQTHTMITSVKFSQNADGKFVVEHDELSVLQAHKMSVEENRFDSLEQIATKTIQVLAQKNKEYEAPGLTFSPIVAPSSSLAREYFSYRSGSIDLLAKDFQQKYLAERKQLAEHSK